MVPSDRPRVPGPFTIAQGTPGDGMRNTIDSIPGSLRSNSSEDTVAFQTSSDCTNITTIPQSMEVSDHEESSHSLSDEATTLNHQNHPYHSHTADARIEAWEQECRRQELLQQAEWRQTTTPRPCLTQWDKAWWAVDGRVAVFHAILNPHNNNTTTNVDPITTLSPGNIVTGTNLYTQRCTDGQLIRSSYQDMEDNSKLFERGRPGVIQWLQIVAPVEGFIVYSIDGYSLALPGLPEFYCNPNQWLWRVVCPAGAFVRQGQDLSTDHIETLPYGSILEVRRKEINAMGLSRIEVAATVEDQQGSSHTVHGWCSEYLNPLSGQSGMILRPLPLPVPIACRLSSEEAIISQFCNPCSREVGMLKRGDCFTVTSRSFTEYPTSNCTKRFQLCGDAGWISLSENVDGVEESEPVFEMLGLDMSFDPNLAGRFHTERSKTMGSCELIESESECSDLDQKHGDLKCLVCLCEDRTATLVHGETGHIACCLMCARILKARKDPCPVCRLPIDLVVQHFWA